MRHAESMASNIELKNQYAIGSPENHEFSYENSIDFRGSSSEGMPSADTGRESQILTVSGYTVGKPLQYNKLRAEGPDQSERASGLQGTG